MPAPRGHKIVGRGQPTTVSRHTTHFVSGAGHCVSTGQLVITHFVGSGGHTVGSAGHSVGSAGHTVLKGVHSVSGAGH